jgi:hypothetical protein
VRCGRQADEYGNEDIDKRIKCRKLDMPKHINGETNTMANQQASKGDLEKVRDLFGLAHDLIAQAQFPGHVASKVQDVMQFLAFQFNDFKTRAEALAKADEKPVEAVAEAPKA